MAKETLAMIDIPISVMSFLRGVSEEDKNMVIFILFWGLTDTFENMDLSEGSYERYCCTQFAEWANSYYLDSLEIDSPTDQKEYNRLFDIFEAFNTKVNNAKIWRTLGTYFFQKLDKYNLVDGDILYDIEVYPQKRLIRLTATTD